MWCPVCLIEYREGFTVCSECGSRLVEENSQEMLAGTAKPQENKAIHRMTPRTFLRRYRAHIVCFTVLLAISTAVVWNSYNNQNPDDLPLLSNSDNENESLADTTAPTPVTVAPVNGMAVPNADSFQQDGFTVEGSVRDFVKELAAANDAERLDDAETLGFVWDHYLYRLICTSARRTVAFESVYHLTEIEKSISYHFCAYLILNMYANNDIYGLEDNEMAIGKLEDYCRRYFNQNLDLSELSWKNARKDIDLNHSALQGDNLEANRYTLTYLDRYPGGWVVAHCEQENSGVDEKVFLMRQRSDGSLYIVGCYVEYLPNAAVEGATQVFDESHKDWLPIGTSGEDNLLVCREEELDGISYGVLDVQKNQIEPVLTLPKERLVFEDELLTVITAEQIRVFDDRLQTLFQWEIPQWLTEETGMNALEMRRSEWVTFSSDWKTMLYSTAEGIQIFDLTTGDFTLIPDTEHYIHPESERGNMAYKFTYFVMEESKILAVRVGYEFIVGYLLYDIASGKSTVYDYYGGYSSLQRLDDDRLYLDAYSPAQGEPEPVYIDLLTHEVFPAPEFAAEVAQFVENRWVWEDEDDKPADNQPRYEVLRTPAEESALEQTWGECVSEHIAVFDNHTGSVVGEGCILTRLKDANVLTYFTNSGKLYVRVPNGRVEQGEERGLAFLVS